MPPQQRVPRCETLLQPCLTPDGLEVSLHTCPRALLRELRYVFSVREDLAQCLAIPTNQHAVMDLVNVGDNVESEKDKLLNVFMKFARPLCDAIRAEGYWADYIDPCSGLPMLTTEGNKVYSEVEGMQALMQYPVINAGGCKVLLHPAWGSAVYPATIFTTAPRGVALRLL
ncbi:unnamed protein product, partial [Phaeothamnion confervicola]